MKKISLVIIILMLIIGLCFGYVYTVGQRERSYRGTFVDMQRTDIRRYV